MLIEIDHRELKRREKQKVNEASKHAPQPNRDGAKPSAVNMGDFNANVSFKKNRLGCTVVEILFFSNITKCGVERSVISS